MEAGSELPKPGRAEHSLEPLHTSRTSAKKSGLWSMNDVSSATHVCMIAEICHSAVSDV